MLSEKLTAVPGDLAPHERWTVGGGGLIESVSYAHTDTHTLTMCTYPPTKKKKKKKANAHITRLHANPQIHTPVLSRWMATLIMAEMKKWIAGVCPLFRQL